MELDVHGLQIAEVADDLIVGVLQHLQLVWRVDALDRGFLCIYQDVVLCISDSTIMVMRYYESTV
jgi:hypothetical protein